MVIGITGGIGSGKSLVSDIFSSFENTVYYHADIEAKKIMNTSDLIRKQLISEFGPKSFIDNELNRSYISSIVFNNPKSLKKLNSIVHPVVKANFKEFITINGSKSFIIYENAILFEIGSDVVCDVVISVNTPIQTRIERVMKRDNISERDVLDRIKNQWPDFKRNLLSNYVISNIEKEVTMLKIKNIFNILTKKPSLF